MQVGVAQQWYDEIDHLAFSTPEIEATLEEGTMSLGEKIPEGKVEISCSVNSSPGTSEVHYSSRQFPFDSELWRFSRMYVKFLA